MTTAIGITTFNAQISATPLALSAGGGTQFTGTITLNGAASPVSTQVRMTTEEIEPSTDPTDLTNLNKLELTNMSGADVLLDGVPLSLSVSMVGDQGQSNANVFGTDTGPFIWKAGEAIILEANWGFNPL